MRTEDGIVGILEGNEGLLKTPVAAATGGAIGGAILGSVITATVLKKSKRKKSKSKTKQRRNRTKTTPKAKRRYNVTYARTAGKRKDTSTRRIRMTKYGQPYVITSSGRARFISKKSAYLSKKRKGGRY